MFASNIAPPGALPGFENVKAFWEPKWERYAIKVLPGEYYVSREDVVLTTVLGSCISACICDPLTGFGGMNHFMLPMSSRKQEADDRSLRYGLFAMEQLINELIKHGSLRENLQVKVTGGGDMMRGITDIGLQNIEFIQRYLKDEGLALLASDLGGNRARRVAYFPMEGRMLVNKLDHREDTRLIEGERSYRIEVDQQLDQTDVELF